MRQYMITGSDELACFDNQIHLIRIDIWLIGIQFLYSNYCNISIRYKHWVVPVTNK